MGAGPDTWQMRKQRVEGPLRWPKRVPLVVRAGARTSVFLLPGAFSILLQILTRPEPITEAEEKPEREMKQKSPQDDCAP